MKKSLFKKYWKTKIESEEEAFKYITRVVVLGFIVALGNLYLGLKGEHLFFIDAILILIFTIGVYKKNVYSAILLFSYFLIGKILYIYEYGVSRWTFISFIIVIYFYVGILATLWCHQKNPKKKRLFHGPSFWSGIVLGAIIGLALLFLILKVILLIPDLI